MIKGILQTSVNWCCIFGINKHT